MILPEAEASRAKELFAKLPAFEGRDLIGEVSTREAYRWKRESEKSKISSRRDGLWRKMESSSLTLAFRLRNRSRARKHDRRGDPRGKPDGVFLSNGPGDPSAAPYAAETVKNLVGKIPVFGVCMGHQILGLALGARTYKLKFGHRGGNQPVFAKQSGRVEISSHNHGYAVDGNSLPPSLEVTHINLNDKTVEGMSVKGARAFSVQYHPEACPGPHDSKVLFDQFIQSMSAK